MEKIILENTQLSNNYFHFITNTINNTEKPIVTIQLTTADITLANFGNMPTGHNA